MKYIDIRDLKKYDDDFISINGNSIKLVIQRTGFGYKKFFECPLCGKRRERLYEGNNIFLCRSCINVNIYSSRTNLYDEKGENLIRYKVSQILTELQIDIYERGTYGYVVSMGTFLNIASEKEKPKYMREKRYGYLRKSLFFLDWMYWRCVAGIENYSAVEIKQMLEENNVNFVYENFLFPQYFPEAYKYLKDHGED